MNPNSSCPSSLPLSSASPLQSLPSSSSLSLISPSTPLVPVSSPSPPPFLFKEPLTSNAATPSIESSGAMNPDSSHSSSPVLSSASSLQLPPSSSTRLLMSPNSSPVMLVLTPVPPSFLFKELLTSDAVTSSLESSRAMNPDPSCPSFASVPSTSPQPSLPSSSSLPLTSRSSFLPVPVSTPATPHPLPASTPPCPPSSPLLLCGSLTLPLSSPPPPVVVWLETSLTSVPVPRPSSDTGATCSRTTHSGTGQIEATKSRTVVMYTQGHGDGSSKFNSRNTVLKPLVYIDTAEDFSENNSTENAHDAARDPKEERTESATQKTLCPVGKNIDTMNTYSQNLASYAFPGPLEKDMAICHNEHLAHRTTCIDQNEDSEDVKLIKHENGQDQNLVMTADVKTEAEEKCSCVPFVKTEVIEDEYDVQEQKGTMNACVQKPGLFALPVPLEKHAASCHNGHFVHRTTCISQTEVLEDIKPVRGSNGLDQDSVKRADVKTEAEEELVPHVKEEMMEGDVQEQKDDQHQFRLFHHEPDDGDTDLEMQRSGSNTSSLLDQTAETFTERAIQSGHMAYNQLVMTHVKLEEHMSDREDISDKELQDESMEISGSVCDDSHTGCCLSSDIQGHTRTHTKEQSYKCDFCAKSFNCKCDLTVHERTHTGMKPYKCDTCAKIFNRKRDLIVHERAHTGMKIHKCDICKKSFIRKCDLTVHKRTHTVVKPYRCDFCAKSFIRECDLTVHERTHTGVKPYKCDICAKNFTRKCELTVHERKHTGMKRNKCDICVHERTHIGVKPYMCDICSRSFSRKRDFLAHEKIHTSVKLYKCDICKKIFTRKCDLTVHERTHTIVNPYKCDICAKSFYRKCDLTVHERTHTGVKPYKCDVCAAAFFQKGNFVLHKRKHS